MDTEIPQPKALEEENKQVLERRELIRKVTLKIETIFISKNFTMGEMAEVMDLFNARAHSVFSRLPIKKIKDDYDRLN